MLKIFKFTHFASYLVIISGLVYWLLKEFGYSETEYGMMPSPFQSKAQAWHILVSPLFIFALGLLWKDHILVKIKKSSKKLRSGWTLILLVFPMIVSGYLIQVVSSEFWNPIVIIAHLVSSVVFIAAYLLHHLVPADLR